MPTTGRDLLDAARQEITEITPDEVAELQGSGGQFALIDVREPDEYRAGYIPGADHVSRGFLELKIEQVVPERATPIIAYCAGGVRSLFAGQALRSMGYDDVKSMSGGYAKWKDLGHPVAVDKQMSTEQLDRYSRHFLLSQIGEKGQAKLLDAKVLLIGAGGLGSPTGLYLTAMGVGTIGIIDMDVVDMSNLQRQIIHNNDRVGTSKVESARATITALNPDVNVITIEERLDRTNALEILKDYDIIVNGADNFPTRYLVNDAAVFLGKKIVDASIFKFEGQATVYDPANGGPCYRCLYPEPPPPGMVPSCADAGVLGALCGTMGSIQATEVAKLIVGFGEPLVGKLLMYDSLKSQFRILKARRDPSCPVCGDSPTITELIDYEFFCGLTEAPVGAEANGHNH
jgi:adenylyltransferase/sulfurtransferase|tara:strand:- start:10 stop:1215 length:1206 start_codon:yes stop_codon:yes gene_type:complete